MKKVLFALFALGLYSVGANAQDDVYFVPTKKAILKERQAEREAAARARTESSYTPITGNTAETDYDTWSDQYTGRTVDVDTYNRRGNGLLVDTASADTAAIDSTAYHEVEVAEDYSPTSRLIRFRSPRGVIYASPYYADYIYDLAFYDPWFYDGFYGPSFWYHSWAFSPFYYDPWFYGSWWGSPWHHHWGWYDYCWGWGWNSPWYPGWGPGWHPGHPGWGHGGFPDYASGRSNGRLTGHNFSRGGSTAFGRPTVGTRTTRSSIGRTNGNANRSFGGGRSTGSLGTRYSGSSSRNTISNGGYIRNNDAPSRGGVNMNSGTSTRPRSNSSASFFNGNRSTSSSNYNSSRSSSNSGRSFSSGSGFSGGSSHSSGSRGGGGFSSGGSRGGGRR